MKTLKHIIVLVLFSTLITSCTELELESEEEQMNATEILQATGGDGKEIDESGKDD